MEKNVKLCGIIPNYRKYFGGNILKRIIILGAIIVPTLGTYNFINIINDKNNNSNTNLVQAQELSKLELGIRNYIPGISPLIIDGIITVNKEYILPQDYTPDKQKESQMYDAFEKMRLDAKNDGLTISIKSGYRSYEVQKELYEYYVKKDGEEKASTYSAKPGTSEHQLGLAIDISNGNKTKTIGDWFNDTPQAQWLYKNAHKYGFILRYPKGKEHITGYKYESWHYRYVGTEHSYNFIENDLTLEEYLGLE